MPVQAPQACAGVAAAAGRGPHLKVRPRHPVPYQRVQRECLSPLPRPCCGGWVGAEMLRSDGQLSLPETQHAKATEAAGEQDALGHLQEL